MKVLIEVTRLNLLKSLQNLTNNISIDFETNSAP